MTGTYPKPEVAPNDWSDNALRHPCKRTNSDCVIQGPFRLRQRELGPGLITKIPEGSEGMSSASDCTIDPAEVAHYEAATKCWWDSRSVARWLHRYNLVRVPYIRDIACRKFVRDPNRSDCLAGLRVLDIGCGGGVLCEPLAGLGAEVVGLDPAKTAIGVARLHAEETGLNVDYRCNTLDALLEAGEKFDIVLAMEVIEHVAHSGVFLDRCAGLVSPGGLIIMSTINRTLKSYAFAIAIGEYVLRLLPRGSHQWRKFVSPGEIQSALESKSLSVINVSGVTMNLRSRLLQLSHDSSVNYMLTAELLVARFNQFERIL
jgi:2-polyprenyl-6-hydroxyphenyl methylase/3-demethylubiquinone-9 3-methyltransferase